jgi:perosamine synthetase
MAGLPCDMDRLTEIARHRGIPIVEDAAHAFPAAYRGCPIGTTADISAFSFYATKALTTGEGGMVTTSNRDWADRMRLMSLHGISKNAWKRYAADGSWRYDIEDAGFKYNLTDIAASIGLVQLAKSDRMLADRCRIAERYDAGLREVPEIQLPARDSHTQHAWHLYIIKLDLARLRFDRGEFIERLRQRQIGTSVHFIPLHLHPYYQRTLGPAAAEHCPTATEICARIVSLPIYPSMSSSDVDEVVEAVGTVIAEGRR